MRLAIDASNLGLGGGTTHLIELIRHVDSRVSGIDYIAVFSSQSVLDQVPSHPFVQKVTFPQLNKGVLTRLLFQLYGYDQKIEEHQCDLLFSITGDYIGRIRPVVGMSRNMLLYDRHLWKDFGQLRETLRMWLNFYKQRRCFSRSNGIIFISEHAKSVVGHRFDLSEKKLTLIHHGISNRFRSEVKPQLPLSHYSIEKPFKLLYVSTIHSYKNQWKVVEAVAQLRDKGYPVELHLAGAVIFQPAGELLQHTLVKLDPERRFVKEYGWVNYETIHQLYVSADAFVFASECENMPNILIEAMSAGLPIACSNREPMPEFAGEHAFYFNPRDTESLVFALQQLLAEPVQRAEKASFNQKASYLYDWKTTAELTFRFLYQTYETSLSEQNLISNLQ